MPDRADADLLPMTARIVAAFASNNSVSTPQLSDLVREVHRSLERTEETAPEEPRAPAVPVRRSVKRDTITCLECGSQHKMLKRHLRREHGLTPAEYRERWNLKSEYPMVAPSYAEKRSELAKRIGLGRKPAEKPKRTRGGQRSPAPAAPTKRRSRTKANVAAAE